jgi:transposase
VFVLVGGTIGSLFMAIFYVKEAGSLIRFTIAYAIAGGLSGATASALVVWQLWYLLKRDYPKAKRIHLILDNCRIHSSRQVELVLAKLAGRLQLHFLPPYCPDYNRIERVWRDLHENVTRNHQCRTMNELMAKVRWYLRKRDKALRRLYATKEAGLPGLRKVI